MDAAEPPRIVFENAAGCADGDRVEDALRHALATTRGAHGGFTLTLRVTRTGTEVMRAEGVLIDGRAARVGERVLFGTRTDCLALAQGVGVWASLVLDGTSTAAGSTAVAGSAGAVGSTVASTGNGAGSGRSPEVAVAGPEIAVVEPGELHGSARTETPPIGRPHERDRLIIVQREDEPRALELGASAFLMGSVGRGALTGVSPFLLVEVADGVFLRPSIAAGETLNTPTSGDGRATWLDGRFDGCFRSSGAYASRAGLQLDLCGGADIGGSWGGGKSLAFAAVGPSFDLRGDLGAGSAIAMRGTFGLNLAHTSVDWTDDQIPLWSGRAELAFSWRLR